MKSLSCQTRPVEQVIIVDASDDEYLEPIVRSLFQSIFAECLLVRSIPGLTVQRNLGIRLSHGDIVFFFDDDVLLETDYIATMMGVFETDGSHRYAGGMGRITDIGQPKLLDGVLQRLFFLTESFGSGKFKFSGFPSLPHGSNHFMEVETLSGCAMAFRGDVLDHFNFDETLSDYSYMEDTDFAYRVSRQHLLFYEPKARLKHCVSTRERISNRLIKQMLVRNHRYLFRKNFPCTPRYRVAHLLSLTGLFFNPLLKGDLPGTWGTLEGLLFPRRTP